MPVNTSITAGALQPPQQQNPIQQLAALMQIMQAQKQGEMLQSKMAHEEAMRPYEIEKLKAETEAQRALPGQRAAQENRSVQESLIKLMQHNAAQEFASQLAKPDEKTAEQMAIQQELNNRERVKQGLPEIPVRIEARNPFTLQSLAVQARPESITNVLNQMKPTTTTTSPLAKAIAERDALPAGDPRRAAYDQYIAKIQTHPPQQEPVVVVNREGRNVYVPRSQAPGQDAPLPQQRTRLVNTQQGIMIEHPDGTMTPAEVDGQRLMPPGAGNAANNQAINLSREFNALPEIKRYNTITPGVNHAAQYVIDVATKKRPATPADDLALTKMFLAMTHPQGDQITNLDNKQLAQLPDLPGRIQSSIVGLLDGKQLTDDMRKQFWATIQGKYGMYRSAREARQKEFEARIKAMPGVDPAAVFGSPPQ